MEKVSLNHEGDLSKNEHQNRQVLISRNNPIQSTRRYRPYQQLPFLCYPVYSQDG